MLLDEPTNGLDPAGRDEMLELVRRTGREFGIAIIMASHLLGEIERVCDHLVVIDAGRLVQSAPIQRFLGQTGTLAVEVEGAIAPLAAALRGRGFQVREHGRELYVEMTDEGLYDVIRDQVVDLGLGLIRLEQRRQQLEELFRPVREEEAASV
jgi:ABC-2 type transport system ATP-binding protein